MERLTEAYEGRYYIKTSKGCMPVHEIQGLVDRLAAYENTGFSPERLEVLDRLYLEKCREVAHYRGLCLDAGRERWNPDGKPMAGKKVAYSFDNECYSGCFGTDSEARAEALEEIKRIAAHSPGDVPGTVYIGECEFFAPSLAGTGLDIIDAVQFQAYDAGYREQAEDYLCVPEETSKELEMELEYAFRGWIERHNLHPDFYKVSSYDIYKYDAGTGELQPVRTAGTGWEGDAND